MIGEPTQTAPKALHAPWPEYQISSEKLSSHYIASCVQPEKQLYNQSSQYERYGQFSVTKGSHHVQLLNQYFLLSAKMNGTQRRILVSP